MNSTATMSENVSLPIPRPVLDSAGEPELQAILIAWNEATDRLQATHETLRTEVRRLSDELEHKNRELARKNRLADLGQMATHVAHEVRNSLVPLTLYLSLLRRQTDGDLQTAETLDKFAAGFTALEAIVNDLLQFTSHREPTCRRFFLRPLVVDVLDSLSPQLAAQSIRLDLDIPADLTLVADQDMIRRAILNLVLNALDAMPTGGELTAVAVRTAAGLELEIADDGPGVPQAQHTRLFEPFFTTKQGGTGLGLAIVERIAASHGGGVSVCNCPQGGAAFTIRIPDRKLEAAA